MSVMEQRVAHAVRLIREAADDHGDGEVPQAVLDGLNEVVPGLWVCFAEINPAARQVISFQASDPFPPDEGDDVDAFWRVYPELAPCHYLYDGNVIRDDVVKLSDFLSDRALANTALFHEYLLPNGERYEMYLPVPTRPGQTRLFVFSRWDGDFAEADRDLLTLLQPHLNGVYQAHQRRRAGIPPLTTRQWQVLHCLAAGQSTDEIAPPCM